MSYFDGWDGWVGGHIYGEILEFRSFSLSFIKNHKNVKFYFKIENKWKNLFFFNRWVFVYFPRFDPVLTHIWPFWWVIFGNFGGRKSRFLDFFKVVWELIRKCLDIIFGLKRPTLCEFSAPKIHKWPRKSGFSVKIWPTFDIWEGHFWQFWGSKKSISWLLQNCFGVVYEVLEHCFLVLKCPLFGVFSALKVHKWTRKLIF